MSDETASTTGRRRLSRPAKVALAIGGVALLIAVLFGIALTRELMIVQEQIEPYVEQGYATSYRLGPAVTRTITTPTVFVAMIARIEAESEAALAFRAHRAYLSRVVKGPVDFDGHELRLLAGCRIEGDLRIHGAHVVVFEPGAVVTGNVIVDAHAITIAGGAIVHGDLDVNVHRITLEPEAVVAGAITGRYATLEQAKGARVGPSEQSEPQTTPQTPP